MAAAVVNAVSSLPQICELITGIEISEYIIRRHGWGGDFSSAGDGDDDDDDVNNIISSSEQKRIANYCEVQ